MTRQVSYARDAHLQQGRSATQCHLQRRQWCQSGPQNSTGQAACVESLKCPVKATVKGRTKTYQLYTYYMVCVHGYENMGWSFRFYGAMNWRITGSNQDHHFAATHYNPSPVMVGLWHWVSRSCQPRNSIAVKTCWNHIDGETPLVMTLSSTPHLPQPARLQLSTQRSCCMALCRQLLGREPHGLADVGDENLSLTEENMKFPKMINKLHKIPSNSQMSSTVVLVCPRKPWQKMLYRSLQHGTATNQTNVAAEAACT